MRIAIDTSPLSSGHAIRGIGTYTRLLIDALKQYDTNNQYLIIQNHVPRTSYHEPFDLIHYPYFDLFFLTLPLIKAHPTVVTIHDVIPLIYPQAYPPGTRGKIKYQIQKYSLKSTQHIVTDSQCSTNDVIKYLSQPESKVSTIYLAPNPVYESASTTIQNNVTTKYDLSKKYLLYVGDINFNKNLPRLLKVVASLHYSLQLVIVSKALRRDNPAAASLWELIDRLHIEPRLRILTNIPSQDIETMKGLYSSASWYIQPSLYEGFGLPVLEAQACGCPVIASTGGSLPEITQNSVIAFNPKVLRSMGQAIEQALDSNTLNRDQYIQLGYENLKRFSWQKTVEAMQKVYQTCV